MNDRPTNERVAVVGAGGPLGAPIVRGLRGRAVVTRPLSRQPLDDPDAVVADLRDRASLDRAFAGVTRLFLVSSPAVDQVAHETNAIDAAERAGIERIVKISNIPIAGLDSGLHGNHRAVERRLATSPIGATVLQPSFFTSVLDRQRELIAQGTLVLPTRAGRIAWIEPDDIAAVAVEALVRDDALEGELQLTGPEALDGDEVAARLGVRRLDPPLDRWCASLLASGMDPWLVESTVHLYEAVQRDALAEVTTTVTSVLGRPPRRAFAG